MCRLLECRNLLSVHANHIFAPFKCQVHLSKPAHQVCACAGHTAILEGWAGVFDMIHRMLAANIAPTATALKRVGLEDAQELVSADYMDQPDTILNFLTNGGRSVGLQYCTVLLSR